MNQPTWGKLLRRPLTCGPLPPNATGCKVAPAFSYACATVVCLFLVMAVRASSGLSTIPLAVFSATILVALGIPAPPKLICPTAEPWKRPSLNCPMKPWSCPCAHNSAASISPVPSITAQPGHQRFPHPCNRPSPALVYAAFLEQPVYSCSGMMSLSTPPTIRYHCYDQSQSPYREIDTPLSQVWGQHASSDYRRKTRMGVLLDRHAPTM